MSPVAPGGTNEPAPPNEPALPGRPGWDRIPDLFRARGLRWTPQRARLLAALAGERGHVTGSRLVERCREIDPATTPSTVYRTLDVLEALGVISHSHGIDGHEEFHVRPVLDHGHLICSACGTEDELPAADAAPFLDALEARHGFRARVDHLTVVGLCRGCRSPRAARLVAGAEGPSVSGLRSLSGSARHSEHSGHEDGRDP